MSFLGSMGCKGTTASLIPFVSWGTARILLQVYGTASKKYTTPPSVFPPCGNTHPTGSQILTDWIKRGNFTNTYKQF